MRCTSGGGPPPEGDAGRHVHRKAVPGHHRGDGGQPDDQLHQPLHGARQVRQGDHAHRHRRGDDEHRVVEVVSRQRRVVRAAAGPAENEPHEGRQCARSPQGQRQVADDGPAVGQEGHRRQDHDESERSEEVDGRDQPADAVGWRADEVEDLVLLGSDRCA